MNIDDLIKERHKSHGPFKDFARIDQALKRIKQVYSGPLSDAQASSIDMIFNKIARILSGNPEELDHWVDIQGYSRIIEKSLSASKTAEKAVSEKSAHATQPIEQPENRPKNRPDNAPKNRPKNPPKTTPLHKTPLAVPEKQLPALSEIVIQTYRDMDLKVIDARSLCPEFGALPTNGQIDRKKIKLACDLTMKKVNKDYIYKEAAQTLIQNLFCAEHNSIFEHCNLTFLASGISRSLLAQVTRQGTFRFTSASQQYQDYRRYPMSLRPHWDKNTAVAELYRQALNQGLDAYKALIAAGEKPEEARQVLPPAATVNLMLTANARNIARFLRVRLCSRNVDEMVTFAWKLHKLCIEWLPELFLLIHAPCAMDGVCNQGKMSCGKPFQRLKRT